MIEQNVNLSYIRDMYSSCEIENLDKAKFNNDINWKLRTVDGIKYRDPYYNCHRLYDETNELLFKGELIKGFDPNDKKQIVLLENNNGTEYRLTTDYIGPSLTSMKRADISDKDAWRCTVKCRTLGGHLVWPRMPYGINPSKAASGKRGYGISDRIDIALYEIKCVLDKKSDSYILNKKLRNAISRKENIQWFKGKSFHQFCEDFYLIGSFVDENDEIIWLAEPHVGKINTQIMGLYMKKNLEAIINRNLILGKKLNK